MNDTLHIKTRHLELIPCSLEVAQAATKNKSQVEKLLAVCVPEDWYSSEVLDFLPMYAQMLTNDPAQLGWGVWLIIHPTDSILIGDLGFGGKPDEQGIVEMGYEVLPAYRHQGYAFEAVQALVDWAFNQPALKRIIAHSPQNNTASIRILEKLGMQRLKQSVENPDLPEVKVFKWELTIQSRSIHHS